MKHSIKWFLLTVEFLAALFLSQTLFAAVNFNIIPSAVSNTYFGPVTLQVTGLTNTETVVVQKFLDVNTNGVVDAVDLLWQQFQLKDGSASVFTNGTTSVTNFNVPCDMDGSTNGSITAQLNQSVDFAQRIVGKYLFVLSSPVGHFLPLTNSFSVTNFPFGQKFTGNVLSNGTSTTLSNTLVFLASPTPGNLALISGTVAGNSGSYSIQAQTGTYMLIAVRSNFLGSLTAAANLVLGSGLPISTNLNLITCTQSISGKVVDANNSNLAIPGYLFGVSSQSGQFGVDVTDNNGNFTTRVTSDKWGLRYNPQALMLHGYLAIQSSPPVDTTTGSVPSMNIALPKATAVFYGSVKDTLGNPMPGVWIYAEDNINAYYGEGVTDVNGNYVAAVLGGTNIWQVGIDNSLSFPNYVFSGGSQFTITNGQAIPFSFTGALATNHITGQVTCNGAPIVGVQIDAGGTGYGTHTFTDNNGNYSLNVNNDDWSVDISDDGDGALSSNYQRPNPQTVTINNNNGLANFTLQTNINIGGTLQVTTTSPLTNGTVTAAYSQQLNADGGSPPQPGNYSWSPISGLPPGLSLQSGGFITGTPTTNGTYNFTVQVTDQNSHTANKSLSLAINPQPALVMPVWLTNQFSMWLTGASNQNYTLQMSTNLASSNWITVLITNNRTTNVFRIKNPSATNKQSFYRILIGP